MHTTSIGTVLFGLLNPSVKEQFTNLINFSLSLILLIPQACTLSAAHSPSRLHVIL